MDPVTGAILAAIAAGVKKVGESAIVDGYTKLKGLLAKRFGGGSDISGSIERLEQKPGSEGRQKVLAEEITEAGADKDSEVLTAVEALREAISAAPGGRKILVKFTGSGGVAIGNGSTAVGKRGVSVGGSADGSIITTGDGAAIKSEDK